MSLATLRLSLRRSLGTALLAAVLPSAAVLSLAPGCASTGPPDGRWAEAEVEAKSYRILWEYTLMAFRKLGYPDSSGIDPNSLIAESGWDMHLQPFKGAGYRARAVVELEEVGSDLWGIRVRVKRQFNQAVAKPLDVSYAEWEWGPDDEVEAQVLLQTIRSYALTSDPESTLILDGSDES